MSGVIVDKAYNYFIVYLWSKNKPSFISGIQSCKPCPYSRCFWVNQWKPYLDSEFAIRISFESGYFSDLQSPYSWNKAGGSFFLGIKFLIKPFWGPTKLGIRIKFTLNQALSHSSDVRFALKSFTHAIKANKVPGFEFWNTSEFCPSHHFSQMAF